MVLTDGVHLVSDGNLVELHDFAKRINLSPRYYQRGHYDLLGRKHASALQHGAVQVSSRELVRRMIGRARSRRSV